MKEFIEYANSLSDKYCNTMLGKLSQLINDKLTYEYKKGDKKYSKEYDELISFIRHMHIVGFNSGNYDINLCKNYGLINYLLGDNNNNNDDEIDDEDEDEEKKKKSPIKFVAKRGNKYLAIQSEKLTWLDMSNFLAAG